MSDTWTVEEYRAYLRTGIAPGDDRPAVSAADCERDLSHALAATPPAVQVDKKFRVRVTSRGRRLADTDGNSVKAALDGITAARIWRDDSSKFIEEISFTQKAGKKNETIIELWELK